MVVRHHGGVAAGQVGYGHTDDGVLDRVNVGGFSLLDRLHPHVEADVVGFHRVVGHGFLVTGVLDPLVDKVVVGVGIHAHEVVPGGQVAHQRRRVDTGQFLLTHGEGNHRDVGRGDALVAQFAVEGHVGVTVDGGHHGGLLAGGTEGLDVGDDVLPVGVAERGVVDHDVFGGHTTVLEVGLEDLVGGARVDVVGTGQYPALNAEVVHQVVHRRDRLLVGGRTGVEDVLGRLFTFVLDRVEQQAVQLLHHRQYGFTGHGGPVTEDHVHLFLGQQFTGLFGEQRPVGGRVDHHRFQLTTQQAAVGVLLFDQHFHGVFQRGFTDGHSAGQRVQYAHLDGTFFRINDGGAGPKGCCHYNAGQLSLECCHVHILAVSVVCALLWRGANFIRPPCALRIARGVPY